MLDQPSCFGESEIGNALSFGFSYIEYEDHTVYHILTGPSLMKKVMRDIDAAVFVVGKDYIGELWTARLYLIDKIPSDHIMFSNADLTVVLDLNLNRME